MDINVNVLCWILGGLFTGLVLLGVWVFILSRRVKETDFGRWRQDLDTSTEMVNEASVKINMFTKVVESVLQQEVVIQKGINSTNDRIFAFIAEAAEVKKTQASVEKLCGMVKAEVEALRGGPVGKRAQLYPTNDPRVVLLAKSVVPDDLGCEVKEYLDQFGEKHRVFQKKEEENYENGSAQV